MIVLIFVLGVLLITSAAAALYMKHIVSAIITSGVVSLVGSLFFLLAGAPDVAMTEAAIGSALTTVIFLFAWSRIRDEQDRQNAADQYQEKYQEQGQEQGQDTQGKQEQAQIAASPRPRINAAERAQKGGKA
ncbi:MAG: DUF4040 domain-containing protein [Spirochaetales bacterium]|nr:DUF4040 domain-containing protein [Spirochaetales bacterium]